METLLLTTKCSQKTNITHRLGYDLIQRTKSVRQIITFCFSVLPLAFILVTNPKAAYAETLECKIAHRLINDRLSLQKEWIPDTTIHTLEASNGTKITSPKYLRMSGKLTRDKARKLVNLRYRLKVPRPGKVTVNYSYKPSKKTLKVYTTATTRLLNLRGHVASGTCHEVKKIVKPKPVVKPKPMVKPKPAYISGTILNSLHINFKNSQLADFMCELEAVFHNVRTKQNTIIPFFPNVDGLGHSILTTDLEDSFNNSLPKLDNLTIKIQSSTGSSCKPTGLSYLALVDNSFNKLVKINQNGRIEIPNFEIKNLQ